MHNVYIEGDGALRKVQGKWMKEKKRRVEVGKWRVDLSKEGN